jgi:CHAT domain-containing protein
VLRDLRRLEEAEGAYREAESLDPQHLSGAGWRALANLGLLYRAREEADQAYQSWAKALTALEIWRGRLDLPADRLSFQSEYADVYTWMVSLCLEQGWPERAWHWAERAKGRTLADLLAGARPRLDTPAKQQLYQTWEHLHQEILSLEARLAALSQGTNGHGGTRGPAQAAAPTLDLQARSREIAALEAELREKRAREAPLWQQILGWMRLGRESVPEAPELARILRELALAPTPAPLPRETGEGPGEGAIRPLLAEFLLTGRDRYRVFLLPLWQVADDRPLPIQVTEEFPIPQAGEGVSQALLTFGLALTAARLGFAGRYRGQAPEEAARPSPQEQAQAREQALGLFEALAEQVGQAFLRPWEEHVTELAPTELLLVGDRFLHLLPLHAGLLGDGQPLIARYPVCYLPNAHIADHLCRQREAPVPSRALVMGPPERGDLPGAWIETETLAHWLGSPRYAAEEMRIRVLQDHARAIGLAHLATHSRFDWERYLESHILFHGERLTLARLLSDESLDFRGTRLFYLGSCESGLSALGAGGDELQGLVWALFLAGARGVMATLWSVDDQAALHMSQRFYHHYVRRGLPLAQAYAEAVRDLRNPWYAGEQAHNPYFWAPFVLYGDGWG